MLRDTSGTLPLVEAPRLSLSSDVRVCVNRSVKEIFDVRLRVITSRNLLSLTD